MKVIIERRHTENTVFADGGNCALCKAIREQYPSLQKVNAGISDVYFNRDFSKSYKMDKRFTSVDFAALEQGTIESFPINIDYPEYDKQIDQLINKTMAKVSDCCGAAPSNDIVAEHADYGVCTECKEDCLYISQEEFDEKNICEDCHGTGIKEMNIPGWEGEPEQDVEAICGWCEGTGKEPK